jgi:hypothetical protein
LEAPTSKRHFHLSFDNTRRRAGLAGDFSSAAAGTKATWTVLQRTADTTGFFMKNRLHDKIPYRTDASPKAFGGIVPLDVPMNRRTMIP